MCKQHLPGVRPFHFPSDIRLSRHRKRKPPARHFVPLAELRPTQAAVGMRAVDARQEQVERRTASVRKLNRYLEKRPIPAVLGPGDKFYIIDRHHLSLALWQAGVDAAFISLIDDLSRLSCQRFWKFMEEDGRLHPFDRAGRRIHPDRLPKRIDGLAHDPYRDLAWSVRGEGGFDKSMLPYSEFLWANFFRTRIPIKLVQHQYPAAVRRAMHLAGTRAGAGLPGFAA